MSTLTKTAKVSEQSITLIIKVTNLITIFIVNRKEGKE
jgi:hypothetical protein